MFDLAFRRHCSAAIPARSFNRNTQSCPGSTASAGVGCNYDVCEEFKMAKKQWRMQHYFTVLLLCPCTVVCSCELPSCLNRIHVYICLLRSSSVGKPDDWSLISSPYIRLKHASENVMYPCI